MLNAIFTVLFIALSTTFSGIVAECPQTAGYLGAFDSFSGAFIGAVFQPPALSRGVQYLGLAALDRTGNPLNYLAVIAFTNSTSEGDAALLQILNPGNPDVPFVSLFVGLPDCNTAAFSNFANPAAILAPSDGFPTARSPLLAWVELRSPAGTGIFFRGAPNDGLFDSECVWTGCFTPCMESSGIFPAFVHLLTWFVADPNGTQHSLFIVQDLTHNFLAAVPDPDIYASSGNLALEEVAE
ncbi:hypothetical protein B0H13DRAFT_2335258 [Mycena leptocephala]|nr:hypothetical protein B0H13DRAFT_2335258 [Mycena leptocephala]